MAPIGLNSICVPSVSSITARPMSAKASGSYAGESASKLAAAPASPVPIDQKVRPIDITSGIEVWAPEHRGVSPCIVIEVPVRGGIRARLHDRGLDAEVLYGEEADGSTWNSVGVMDAGPDSLLDER